MTLFTSFSRFFRAFGCVVLLFSSMSLCAAPPRWMRQLPKASNDHYRYVKADATASSEEEAFNKALGQVLRGSIMSLGLGFNSTQVETAIKTGTLESQMKEWSIPVNVVCRYRQGLENGLVRVYVLCQVANAGNVDPKFEEFRNCGNDADELEGHQANLRPVEWTLYESDKYFAAFEDMEIPSGIDIMAFKTQLEQQARQSLIQNIALKDSTLMELIQVKSQCTKNMGHAVAYVQRQQIIDKYDDIVEEELGYCYGKIQLADSYIAENKLGEANSKLLEAQRHKVIAEPLIRFLNANATDRKVERYVEDAHDYTKEITLKLMQTEGKSSDMREGKILEFFQTAENMLEKHNVGDALRYFYAAQVLLKDVENNDYITVMDKEAGRERPANMVLPEKIRYILNHIQITCDGYLPDNKRAMKLDFRYGGTPISNLNFAYNDNMGWSDVYSVVNGWSSIEMQENNHPTSLRVRIEYRYADEANFDAELPLLMEKYAAQLDYDKVAEKPVSIVVKPTKIGLSSNLSSSKLTTNIGQNYVAEQVMEDAHKVSAMDSAAYQSRIVRVCNAIEGRDPESVYDLFTPNGYDQFERLYKYGTPKIITRATCRYVRIGNDVQCRSIPMNFSFNKGKKQLENVVFTFNNYGKIDGVQFAMEETAARNVMNDPSVDELSRLTLLNFLENYKTAFALKRLDYIESIFSDDAVIITGRVLRPTEQTKEFKDIQMKLDDNRIIKGNVEYRRMSKEQYIKRLRSSFASKEWINIKFGSTMIDPSAQNSTFGVRMIQDYFSNNYGDHGYLFLLIDASDREKPMIRVRFWQPEIDVNTQPFSMEEYDLITRGFKQ